MSDRSPPICLPRVAGEPARRSPEFNVSRQNGEQARRLHGAVGYTMIEMLTTVAIFVIILGLMVSLARYVRDQSAHQITRQMLTQLDGLMAQYVKHYDAIPPITPLLTSATPPLPTAMAAASKLNNEQCIAALKAEVQLSKPGSHGVDPFETWPLTVYDKQTLRDAWGSPLIFMPGQHPLIGMAPSRGGQDQYFFFSAGPDREYLTRGDNLYSYEAGGH